MTKVRSRTYLFATHIFKLRGIWLVSALSSSKKKKKKVGSTLSSAFGNVSQLELGKLQRQQIFLGAKQTSISVKKC